MQTMRIHDIARILSFCIMPAALGCTDDAPKGDDEVGEDGGDDGEVAPIPVDPLEGGGGVPPDAATPGTTTEPWRSPSTLGNGLVHDSRYSPDQVLDQHGFANTDLMEGVAWSGFVENYQDRTRIGFRPAQVRARVTVTPTGNSGSTVGITDQTLYVADDDANYRTEIETYLFGSIVAEQTMADFAPAAQGARPVSIDTFSVDGVDAFEVGYSVAWAYDDATTPWMIVAGRTEASMTTKLGELADAGYRPISIASRERAGISEFAAIFVNDGMPSADWSVSLAVDPANIAAETQAKWEAGFYPIRGSGEQDSWSRFNLVWTRRPPGISVQVRMNLDLDTFKSEDAGWRTHGYHLESVGRYDDEGEGRLLAIWVRYEPYMRWQGTSFASDDPNYLTQYRMFHDQTIRTLSYATEIECSGGEPCPEGTSCFECPDDDTVCFHAGVCVDDGRFRNMSRPSATLHVFKGPDLVFNRAYTFAPAIYEDTPLNASMRLASASKSITAAAVVREMTAQGLPLTTPFNVAAGIQGAPPAMDAVTVLDVLRQLGGFTKGPVSYGDHALIDASPYGTIPINGEEMIDYVVAGHLDVGGNDNYWNAKQYGDSQSDKEIKYSNPGYSMLGELVRVLSGEPYEEYVIGKLLEPLGLEQGVFADPAHRVRARGVTLAGYRAYLVNGGHPYHVKAPQDAKEAGDCGVSPQGWAWTGTECKLLWSCDCIGADCGKLYKTGPQCESDHVEPQFGSQSLPKPVGGDGTAWRNNVGPLDAMAPEHASFGRYSGGFYLGGALLAAGGWHADGVSIGILIRALAQSDDSMWSSLWSPQWWNRTGSPDPNWAYGLGWYVRGNWIAWAGGTEGSMATVLHNRAYDVTVVHLTNASGSGNGLAEFMDPLMKTVAGWGTSAVGSAFPCLDDAQTVPNECNGMNTVAY
jgi:CubicO group peptidase (beta-lactamase class C family)